MPYLHAIYSQTRELLGGYEFCHHIEIRALFGHIVQSPNPRCALVPRMSRMYACLREGCVPRFHLSEEAVALPPPIPDPPSQAQMLPLGVKKQVKAARVST